MDEKLKNAIALFRYGTLSPLITGQTEFKDPWTYFRNNEGKKFEYIDGTYRTICPSTLDRWYKAYKEKGFDGLKPHGRSDIGIQRKIDDELNVYRVKERFRLRYKSFMKSLNLTFEDDLVFLSFKYFKSNFMQIHKGVYNLYTVST